MSNASSCVPILIGYNLDESKEKLFLTLGCMHLDLVFHENILAIPIESSTQVERAIYEQREGYNVIGLMLIKNHVERYSRFYSKII